MTPKHLITGVVGLGVALAGLSAVAPSPAQAADPVTIQLLATNDFHGRINQDGTQAGAAVLSGAVKQLRESNPNTIFAAAGDLIGASTFESFIQNDKPTIDALNEAGLEVSAVGNHEFDRGYDDLVNRVMAPESQANPEGGAEWQYIGANVRLKATGDPAVPATWVKDVAGVQVGFVGAVTEELPTLVNPSGIADIEVTDIVEATNTYADELVADGADLVVLLVHEGAPETDCATMDDSGAFADIINGVNDNVNAIVSGHTHLAYDCAFDGMPVVSAGQYGMALNQLNFSVDPDTGDLLGVETDLLELMGSDPDGNGPGVPPALYPADPAVQPIVAAANEHAAEVGQQPLGNIDGPFRRARRIDPNAQGGPAAVENRGGESTLGNQVAEVHRWATRRKSAGAAQIAFMNPGGLRADMNGEGTGEFPRVLTYKQAAVVQPFANDLVNMDLTGEQIETVLEQQWQREADGDIPTRPFLRLGVSDGFNYTYQEYPDPAHEGARLGEVTGMWLHGKRIDPTATYSVTANIFLSNGGDNFREFKNGTDKKQNGMTDLQAMVAYMDEFGSEGAVAPDYRQHAVEVTFPESAPGVYGEGDHVQFDLASLAMTADGDVQDEQVTVSLGGEELGTFPVDNDRLEVPYDDAGTASVDVTVPVGAEPGPANLIVRGAETGTRVRVPIVVEGLIEPRIKVAVEPGPLQVGERRRVVVRVVGGGDAAPSGEVEISAQLAGEKAAEGFSTATDLDADGEAVLRAVRFDQRGEVTIKVRYAGDENYAATRAIFTRKVRR